MPIEINRHYIEEKHSHRSTIHIVTPIFIFVLQYIITSLVFI